MDTKILLENGTNELEVLEFTLAGNHYGINVAKIREILTYQPVTPIPNAHPCVEGRPVSGLISVTIFSKSRITISRSSSLITPVDTPNAPQRRDAGCRRSVDQTGDWQTGERH